MELAHLRDHTVESLWAAFHDLSPEWQYNIKANSTNDLDVERVFKLVDNERKEGKIIYPSYNEVFRAIKFCTPMRKVKVIILGQDPYHGPDQANGLAFSVKRGQPLPPSLKNIFLELSHDIGIPVPTNGDLSSWARQGVLLLNTALTVEKDKPTAHSNFGWDAIVRGIIKSVGRHSVGILWGKHAQKFKDEFIIGTTICSPHPSPFSADKGFFGSKPFSQCNKMLEMSGQTPVDWRIG